MVLQKISMKELRARREIPTTLSDAQEIENQSAATRVAAGPGPATTQTSQQVGGLTGGNPQQRGQGGGAPQQTGLGGGGGGDDQEAITRAAEKAVGKKALRKKTLNFLGRLKFH